MFCPSCSAENDDRAASCRNCGQELAAAVKQEGGEKPDGGAPKSPMLFARMYRVVLLDRAVYEELRADPVAIAQGFTVVIMATVALLIGAFIEQAGSGGEHRRVALGAGGDAPGSGCSKRSAATYSGSWPLRRTSGRGWPLTLIGGLGLSAAPGMLFLFIGIPRRGERSRPRRHPLDGGGR